MNEFFPFTGVRLSSDFLLTVLFHHHPAPPILRHLHHPAQQGKLPLAHAGEQAIELEAFFGTKVHRLLQP